LIILHFKKYSSFRCIKKSAKQIYLFISFCVTMTTEWLPELFQVVRTHLKHITLWF